MSVKPYSNTNGIAKTGGHNSYPGKPITETITNGLFKVDHKWTVKYWNKAAEKLLGVPANEILGQNLWEKFAASIPLNFYTVYHKAFTQDIPVHFEEYWGEMGAWFDVIAYHADDTLSVSFKSSNRPTQREHPDQQLKIGHELYRFVTQVMNDCLWEWDLQSREMFWIDGGHKRIFGYNIENALIPQSFWESRLHPDDKVRVLVKLNKTIADGSGWVWEDEYRFRRADGNYAYVHDRGHIIYDGDNVASRMIGATRDITARKLNEGELLESERKLSLIARQTVSAIIITDAEEKIIWFNSAFTRITEYKPEEIMGRKLGSFLQGEDTNPATVKYLRQKIKAKQPFDCEIIKYGKSGRKYWMHLQGEPFLDDCENCEGYFVMETDITERTLLETKLFEERITRQKEITDAVLTAQENERADIGKELHDNLNQILTAAKLNIEMAKTDEKNREKFLEKSSDYIVNVMEEIRRISKTLITPGMQVLGLVDSIKILLDDFVMVHPIKIDFRTDGIYEEDLDEKLHLNIFRIVQEQLSNILKHSNATLATINLIRRENEIILFISDNGNGCDTSVKRKGVGITNIMSRAEIFHGRVTILSKPGEGYELKVVLLLNGRKTKR